MEGCTITESFLKLNPEKQRRILHAAYKEFTEQGFEQASTNRIVKEAGIGKGMLFYYFKSKKDLFYYLIEYGTDYVVDKYLNQLDDSEPDFIERHKKATEVKMRALNENPYIFNFLGNLYVNEEVELPEDLEARCIELRRLVKEKRLKKIDTSLFRKDIDPDLIFKILCFCLEGYEKELVQQLKGQRLDMIDYGPYQDEFNAYLAVLKRLFYRQGE